MTTAQREAAALAIASRTNTAAGEALRDFLQESTDPELVLRWELTRLLDECRDPACDCVGCRRSRELRAKLSAWPCPRCEGETGSACGVCGNAGRLLPVNDAVITWDCGFPRWVTLPTLVGDAVREVMVFSYSPDALAGADATMTNYLPTFRLRALAAVPPWGVPLDGVRVGDREPLAFNWSGVPDCPLVWNFNHDASRAAHCLPRFLLSYLDGRRPEHVDNGLRYYPTEQAAADALARGLVKFARGYKG
jgi:hypothetical protein